MQCDLHSCFSLKRGDTLFQFPVPCNITHSITAGLLSSSVTFKFFNDFFDFLVSPSFSPDPHSTVASLSLTEKHLGDKTSIPKYMCRHPPTPPLQSQHYLVRTDQGAVPMRMCSIALQHSSPRTRLLPFSFSGSPRML